MEDLAPGDSDPLATSSALLDQADIYIGILAFRYGLVPVGQEKSLTEIEFERAGAKGIPRLVFLMGEDHPVRVADVETGPGAEKLRRFKAAARRDVVVTYFRSADELKAAIVTALVGVLHEQPRHSEPRTALLLLPFDEAHEHLRRFLSRELESQGVRVLTLDRMLTPGARRANAIAEGIREAGLIVADVTNANPNVMYELGYAHALKKPTIILCESEASRFVPSDLSSFLYLTYDKRHLEALGLPLERFLREYVKEGRR